MSAATSKTGSAGLLVRPAGPAVERDPAAKPMWIGGIPMEYRTLSGTGTVVSAQTPAYWFHEPERAAAVATYRRHYLKAAAQTVALPGAEESRSR
jgi:hypothetical protein